MYDDVIAMQDELWILESVFVLFVRVNVTQPYFVSEASRFLKAILEEEEAIKKAIHDNHLDE